MCLSYVKKRVLDLISATGIHIEKTVSGTRVSDMYLSLFEV